MNDLDFMREALKEAAIACANGDWAIGCVIVYDGKIIARGHNKVYSTKNRLAHAEITALEELQQNHFDYVARDLTLYTTFEPCPMCFGAILLTGIRIVHAGVNIDESGATASLHAMPPFFTQPRFKTTLHVGLLARACAEAWSKCYPAQKYFSSGHITHGMIEQLHNEQVQTFETPVHTTVDFHKLRQGTLQKSIG